MIDTEFRGLTADELALVGGGATNGDNPFVKAAMNAFMMEQMKEIMTATPVISGPVQTESM
jgi:hypothetical protein